MLEETINIIDYTGIAGVANDVIKKGMTYVFQALMILVK